MTSVTDARGVETAYQYDSLGQLVSVCQNYINGTHDTTDDTDEDVITTYAYDLLGRKTSVTDALNHTTTYAYDAVGELTSTTDALNHATSYTYDALGNLLTVTDALNHTTSYAYDLDGNLASVTDAGGVKTAYQYDSLGQRISVCQNYINGTHDTTDDADEDVITSYTYDLLGELLTTTDALSHTTTYAYDALGQKTSVTDALNHATTDAYDAVGQLTSTTDADGDTTSYTYDAVGNLLTLTDAEDNTTTYTYDAMGRVLSDTNELAATRSYEYDAVGNLVESTDRNGRVIQYSYDALERKTGETWLDSQENVIHTTSYSYDAVGRMLTAADALAAYSYGYDAVGNLTSQTQVLAGLSATIVLAYQYNAVNACTQVAETIGGTADAVTEYSYDALGRVGSMTQHGVTGGNAVAEKRVDFTYDALGRYATLTTFADLAGTQLVATAGYSFDDAYRLVGLTYSKGPTTLASYVYTYDVAGELTSMTTGDGTTDYAHDASGQLSAADSDYTDDEAYTYDDAGNRLTSSDATYTIGTNNQLLADGTYTYTYDAEGNRTSRTRISSDPADDYLTEYAWDYRNRLTSVTFKNNSGEVTKTVAYTYDYANRWIGETIFVPGENGGTTTQTRYVYDGNQIVAQFDKSGTGDLASTDLSHRYLWDAQAVDHLFADEQVTSLNDPGSLLYALTDHENSIRDLVTYDAGTDTTTVANHRIFDTYGNLDSQTNAAVDCLFGYTGRALDEATDLQNNTNRWYEAITGRWLSQDPIGFAGGDANLYRYVGNSPTNWVDPNGLCRGKGGGNTIAQMEALGMGGTVTDPALVPASGTQPSGGREDSGEDSDEGCWDNFWGNYWHYLTNHGDMDRDLEVGETVGVGMIAVGSGGLAGIGAGTVVGGMLVDAGMGCELATAIGSLLGSGVGSEVGREIGQGLDGDTAGMIGEVGGGILGGMIDPVCFAAGTPVLTPEGTKAIEQIKVGDLVLSLPEDDPNGPVVAKRVEEVFERSSVLFDLHVGGKLIRTTAEHPFYVQGKGWTAAKSLVSGDLLRSHDGQWVPVESTCDSGEIAPVYNMRVEDFHTYFVGSAEWGFSIWVHNACFRPSQRPADAPSGTLPINEHPDTADIVHEIKKGLKSEGVGPPSYVGIAPNGDVIVSTLEGIAENLGHWAGWL